MNSRTKKHSWISNFFSLPERLYIVEKGLNFKPCSTKLENEVSLS